MGVWKIQNAIWSNTLSFFVLVVFSAETLFVYLLTVQVRYTGNRDRPLGERRLCLQSECREGHAPIVSASQSQLTAILITCNFLRSEYTRSSLSFASHCLLLSRSLSIASLFHQFPFPSSLPTGIWRAVRGPRNGCGAQLQPRSNVVHFTVNLTSVDNRNLASFTAPGLRQTQHLVRSRF